MDLLVILLAIPVGLVVGGFVTMLVDRIPDKTTLSPRSRCPFCEHPLAVHETIPVVSWLVQRGQCRHCGDKITPAYPIVELVTMGLWVAVAAKWGGEWTLLPPLVLVTAATALSVIDLYHYRLPDNLVFPAAALSAIAIVVAAFAVDRPAAIGRAFAGMVFFAGFLFILHLISPRAMGFGDVKFALFLGLHLGWASTFVYVSWVSVTVLVFYALLLASAIFLAGSVLIMVLRRMLRREILPDPLAEPGHVPKRATMQALPYGPGLATATMLLVFFVDSVG